MNLRIDTQQDAGDEYPEDDDYVPTLWVTTSPDDGAATDEAEMEAEAE